MITRSCSVVVVASLLACAAPPEESPPPAGSALLFAPLPDAFRLPDDDVDADLDGLQVDVDLTLENADDVDSATLTTAAGSSSADVVDGRVTLRVTLEVGPLPGGAENLLQASAGALTVQRLVIGLDRSEDAPPVPGACVLSVGVDGNGIVTCSGGDPLDGDAQTLLSGGVIALRTAPVDDDAAARVRMAELRGGAAQFPFAFDVDGDYVFAATLLGSGAFFGVTVSTSATATVDVD